MLDGSSIAAILTGILALAGAIATAWMSGWNEQRTQTRLNRKALARYSVPLLIAAWDLANWFFDILEEPNYRLQRCNAYGSEWDSQFTSYLLGQYFAGVHIVREMTHFFAHIKSDEAEQLKTLLWKIQDEFVSMNYEGVESLPMRWFEGDILAAQEHMTEAVDHDGDGAAQELRTIGWIEFQKKYDKGLSELFQEYEDDLQRIIYRRFKRLYSDKWDPQANPQAFEIMKENAGDDVETRNKYIQEEDRIKEQQKRYPNISVIVPDHRVRRLQHLLSDLVELLDTVSTMKLNRPVRRCLMPAEHNVSPHNNPLGLEMGGCVPCDCSSLSCNPKQEDFKHRQLPMKEQKSFLAMRKSPQERRVGQDNASIEKRGIVERSKV
ncbi:hypothetical protein SVAN01_02427 [Stagonosporopsis vannaccii]|nr:hypothetical protein SVAN01_02427 [Stagonosporopsis vannaccii]